MVQRHDDRGTSSPFTFAVAGVILLAVVGTLLVATQLGPRNTAATDDQVRRGDAESLLDRFVESQGVGWEAGPDGLTSVGIRAQNGSGLDLARMQTMRGALYDATANGKLDYDEALALLDLDLDSGQRFHLRVAPVGLQAVLTEDLSGLRTAYIADFDNLDTTFSVSLGTDAQMIAEGRSTAELDISPVALNERNALTSLGLGYDDKINLAQMNIGVDLVGPDPPLLSLLLDPGLLQGDVYPDQKLYLNAIIPTVLDDYEVLIIGSNVDHNALTSNAFKAEVEDFIYAGGTLIVFGSDSQSFQWLESLFGVGIETANGGAYAPDVDHPVLREPYQLEWPAYENFGQAWGGKSGGNNDFDTLFQHVIQGDDGDVLAVSLDGAFGQGRVFLSTYRPHEIANDIDLQEAMNLINNIVVYADRSHLFLDYGPAPPQDQSVAAASRTSYVWDEELGQVPVRVTMFVWG